MEIPSKAADVGLHRSMSLFLAIVRDCGRTPLPALVDSLGIAQSTGRRLVKSLVDLQFLAAAGRGRYVLGSTVAELSLACDVGTLLKQTCRPALRRLSAKTGLIAHLGILERDMVTYIVKEGRHCDELFTREGGQLEAYCSAVGKVLLAHLPDAARDQYLAGSPFVALTPRTIVDPETLRSHLEKSRVDGVAGDNAEVAEALFCLAVPVLSPDGRVYAAISVSDSRPYDDTSSARYTDALKEAASTIAKQAGGLLRVASIGSRV